MEDMEDVLADCRETRAYIEQFMKEQNIDMPRQYQEVFDHHLNVMIYRLQNNELVEMDDQSGNEQVSSECMRLSEQLMEPLFKKYSVEKNEVEITLVAIYFNLAKESMENE